MTKKKTNELSGEFNWLTCKLGEWNINISRLRCSVWIGEVFHNGVLVTSCMQQA